MQLKEVIRENDDLFFVFEHMARRAARGAEAAGLAGGRADRVGDLAAPEAWPALSLTLLTPADAC